MIDFKFIRIRYHLKFIIQIFTHCINVLPILKEHRVCKPVLTENQLGTCTPRKGQEVCIKRLRLLF